MGSIWRPLKRLTATQIRHSVVAIRICHYDRKWSSGIGRVALCYSPRLHEQASGSILQWTSSWGRLCAISLSIMYSVIQIEPL